MDDLLAPYEPAVIEYEDAGVAEFVLRDCFAVYHERSDGTALIVDEAGEPIGFRWPLKRL